jgi:hypothetical protein
MPLEVFDQVERPALQPLPLYPRVLAEWKRATLHADCHVVFAGAYYSAPHRLIRRRLWVRATSALVAPPACSRRSVPAGRAAGSGTNRSR